MCIVQEPTCKWFQFGEDHTVAEVNPIVDKPFIDQYDFLLWTGCYTR